jgi:hypothetical protein
VATLAAAFDEHLAPACRQPLATCDILPMSLDTLKALTWDLVCFAVPSSQIELVWKSVQARHRHFQRRPPLYEADQYASWVRMLGSVRWRPMALKLPIQKVTVHWLLAWRPTMLAAHRARLLTVGRHWCACG